MTDTTAKRRVFTRRRVLIGGGLVIGGIVAMVPGCSLIPPIPGSADSTNEDAIAWVRLRPDGRFEFLNPRQEMGQQVATGLRQIVAEELGVPPEMIGIVQPSTDQIPGVKRTAGSDSIRDWALPLAKASAALHLALARRAAKQLGVAASNLGATGKGFTAGGGKTLTYKALAAAGPARISAAEVEAARPKSLRPGAAKRWVGTSTPPDEHRNIVTGKTAYARDVRLANMAYGHVFHPPVPHAALKKVTAGKAASLPGYVALVVEKADAILGTGAFVGVVAETPFALEAIVEEIAVTWRHPKPVQQKDIDRMIDVDRALKGGLEHTLVSGTVREGGTWDVDARFDIPFADHAPMEPRAATALVKDGRATIWTGTQDAFYVRKFVARVLEMAEDKVEVRSQRLGGGYGGRALIYIEPEVARLARKIGRPVTLQWSRTQEFRNSVSRPPTSQRVRARLTEDGRIADWSHAIVSGPILFPSVIPSWTYPVIDRLADKGVSRSAASPYKAARAYTGYSDIRLPIHTGPWRSLGAAANVFAIEMAVSALARKAGRDPLAFRLANMAPEQRRLARTLKHVAGMAKWGKTPPPTHARAGGRRGRGIACGIYKGAYISYVADVRVGGDGAVQVEHAYAAADCGLVINPDLVRAQIEGCIVWGIGMTLSEEFMIEDGAPAPENFDSYALPRMPQIPAMTIALVGAEENPPAGMGETGLVAIGAAIAAAIVEATGKPVRRLPYKTA
jgi:CO/xanthine dehydrogenase Mo-binding subunit